jgi:hypothetical protein
VIRGETGLEGGAFRRAVAHSQRPRLTLFQIYSLPRVGARSLSQRREDQEISSCGSGLNLTTDRYITLHPPYVADFAV